MLFILVTMSLRKSTKELHRLRAKENTPPRALGKDLCCTLDRVITLEEHLSSSYSARTEHTQITRTHRE